MGITSLPPAEKNALETNEASLVEPELGLWILARNVVSVEGQRMLSCLVVERIAQAIGDGLTLVMALKKALNTIDDRQTGDAIASVVAVRIVDGAYDLAWFGGGQAYHWHSRRLDCLTSRSRHGWASVAERRGKGLLETDSEIVIGYRHGRLSASEYLVLCSKVVGGMGLDALSMQCDESRQAVDLADVVMHCGEEETILLVASPPQAKLATHQLLAGTSPIDPQKMQPAGEPVLNTWKRLELAIVAGSALVTFVLLGVIAWVWFLGSPLQEVVIDEPHGRFQGLYSVAQGDLGRSPAQ
jgi:hypothetical protein